MLSLDPTPTQRTPLNEHKPKPVAQNIGLLLDDDFLEEIAFNSRYSTDPTKPNEPIAKIEKEGETFIVINNNEIPVKTLRVDPNKTRVWSGNPRNFEIWGSNIDDLMPLITASNGNTIPVYARIAKAHDSEYIEVIAGTRRRKCCIEGGFTLLVHLITCSDEEALTLAENENLGRTKTSFIADCRWNLSQYLTIKEDKESIGDRYTQENFADFKRVNLTTMQDYLAFGKFPEWLIKAVKKTESFSYRACNELRSLLRIKEAEMERSCTPMLFSTARELIKTFKPEKISNKATQGLPDTKTEETHTPESKPLGNAPVSMNASEDIVTNKPTIVQIPDEQLIEFQSMSVFGIKDAITIKKTELATSINISSMLNDDLLESIIKLVKSYA